jgi:hypothetical protein
MKTIKGPGIFLAQFAGDAAPFNTLKGMAEWAAGLGFTGVQIPTWDRRLFDLKLAAESQGYCDEVLAWWARRGLRLPSLRRICKASWWQAMRPTMFYFKALRLKSSRKT